MEDLYSMVAAEFGSGMHSSHDFKHACRVARLAHYIATKEGYDPAEAEVAGLLHDMGRTVQEEEKGHGPAGVPLAHRLLDAHTTFDEATKQRILDAVADHSDLDTEATLTNIVRDADMLDGLGAIGLSRAYTSKSYLPDYFLGYVIPTEGKREFSIHHQIAFQMEWLDFMHFPTSKQLAAERYKFMQDFLQQFQHEAKLPEDL